MSLQTSASETKLFATRTLILVAGCVALNMALGQTVSILKLPVFLDSIGTMLAGVVCGPLVGLLTGLLTNLLWGLISSPTAAAFAPVAATIGLVAGLLARAGFFRQPWGAAIAGGLIAVALAFVAVPIRIYLFGGVSGSGADFLTAYLLKIGQSLFGSVIVTVISTNLIDKVVTALIVWGIVKGLPGRLAGDFPFLARTKG